MAEAARDWLNDLDSARQSSSTSPSEISVLTRTWATLDAQFDAGDVLYLLGTAGVGGTPTDFISCEFSLGVGSTYAGRTYFTDSRSKPASTC